jgi:tRNA threonylcarbamoyladenosine biosynthesis protein TsaE
MILRIKNTDELPAAGRELLKAAGAQRILTFQGAMGAGKTTFIQALCRELGVKDRMGSPTYSLVNEYKGGDGAPIYHFDFYRIKAESEAQDMGLEDYLDSGYWCLIEWPEQIPHLLPADSLRISIDLEGEERCISFRSSP